MRSPLPDPRRRRADGWREFDVITRRVDQPPGDDLPIGRDFSLGRFGTLRLDGPFEHHGEVWDARGRVIGRGPRLARYSRVEVVITPWSDDDYQLRVQPRSSFLPRWGERRQRRYFDLAHAAADRLLPILTV
jgi:hypothetical protein